MRIQLRNLSIADAEAFVSADVERYMGIDPLDSRHDSLQCDCLLQIEFPIKSVAHGHGPHRNLKPNAKKIVRLGLIAKPPGTIHLGVCGS